MGSISTLIYTSELILCSTFYKHKNVDEMIRIIIVSSIYYVFHSFCVLGLENNGLTVNCQLKAKAERWKWTL